MSIWIFSRVRIRSRFPQFPKRRLLTSIQSSWLNKPVGVVASSGDVEGSGGAVAPLWWGEAPERPDRFNREIGVHLATKSPRPKRAPSRSCAGPRLGEVKVLFTLPVGTDRSPSVERAVSREPRPTKKGSAAAPVTFHPGHLHFGTPLRLMADTPKGANTIYDCYFLYKIMRFAALFLFSE